MRAIRLKVDIFWLLGLGVATVCAYAIAIGMWQGAVAVLGALILLLLGVAFPAALSMIWLIGFPTVFIIVNNRIGNIPILTAERGMFLLVAGLFIARLCVASETLRRPGAIEKTMGLFLLLVLVSWFVSFGDKTGSEIKDDGTELAEGLLMPFTAFLVARNVDWTADSVKRCLMILVFVIGLYEIAAGIAQYRLGMTFFQPPVEIWVAHADRMTGSFLNSLPFGMVLATLYFLVLLLFLHSESTGQRVLLIGMAMALLLCILLSKGRAVWLGMMVAHLFLFIRCPAIRPLFGTGAVISAIAAPIVLPFVVNFQELASRISDSAPVFNRISAYATAVEMIKDKPLFGFGYGVQTFGKYKADYYTTWGDVPPFYASFPVVPHNQFLNMLVMMGLPGLFMFCLFLYVLWRSLSGVSRLAGNSFALARDMAIFVQASLLVLLVNLFFMDLVGNPYLLILNLFLIGMVVRLGETEPETAAIEPTGSS